MCIRDRSSEGRFGMTLQAGEDGVVVADVDPNGIAAESQLQQGDVIRKVDGKIVKTPADVKTALDRNDSKPSLLVIERDGRSLFLTLRAQ